MTTEEKLVKKRSSYKGRLTMFISYLDTVESLKSSDIAELQLRIGKVESLYAQYDEVQLQLECAADDMQSQLNERSMFESQYYKALARAQNLLTKYNKSNNDDACSENVTRASNHRLVKLPTIQLPKFSGSYENWLEFHDTFSSLIHTNDEIDEINKFHYLRASLEGSAAVVIQSFEFSASNYAVAWKVLCERFDNKRLLIQNHVSALFNIDPISRESSVVLKRLIDNLNKNLRALESLGEPVKQCDTLLIHIVTHKLDQKTYREWEECKGRLDQNSSITFDLFIQFVRGRADLIETLEMSRNLNSTSHKSSSKLKAMVSVQHTNNNNNSNTDSIKNVCPKCNGDHNLSNCTQFLALSNEARYNSLPNYKVCYNCFKIGHYANHCKKPGCKLCKRKHNTLVHVSEPKVSNAVATDNICQRTEKRSVFEPSTSVVATAPASINNVALSANIGHQQQDVLLSTALVILLDCNNVEHVARAVLDSGSTSSFMTEELHTRLNLDVAQIDRSIMGINNVTSHVGKRCRVHLKSLDKSYSTDLHCFVLPSITSNVPGRELDLSTLQLPSHICLADPTFYKPAEVDILIGADLFWDLLGSQRIKLGTGRPVLCETRLGWIVSGPNTSNYASLISSEIKCNFAKTESHFTGEMDDIRQDLTRFWQLEEINSKSSSSHYSPEEKLCEDHFVQNTSRLPDGRFCVRIPLKNDPELLGDSLKRATQCLFSLERSLKRKPETSQMYHDFLTEYQLLGHMSECEGPHSCAGAYFIPHHGVLRESSSTTKLRVVFNASSPTTSGISFNDLQMVGPVVQDDLLSILLRFRQHKYILSADVAKMYRCIEVHPDDRNLQQIVWRDNSSHPITAFKLNTVTYGTASAPFLATRCLKQLGLECNDKKTAEIILHDFYVDDLLTGSDDLEEAKAIRESVTTVLASAGMPLRKWRSNEPELLSEISETSLDLNIGSQEPNKLLGLGWHSDSDDLCFPLNSLVTDGNTKRELLSVIAQVFDPLGLLAPCIITMKMLMQGLWLDKLSWDEPLPSEIKKRWNEITKSLSLLNAVRCPRIMVCDAHKTVQLHIFSDASERAYGACAYVRSVDSTGDVTVRLLIAKSRIVPIKPATIPRLELCGALMGARLFEKVVDSLRIKIDQIFFWSDSTIVLGWLRMLPCKLQPFVRNRVAEILEKAGNHTWRHVPTDLNPADPISRGVDIGNLLGLKLWWSGPEFLKNDLSEWPSQPKHVGPLPETRPDADVSLNATISEGKAFVDFSRFSNHSRLIRAVAYALRFIKHCRKQISETDYLTDEELRKASNLLISKCQEDSFPEYKLLLNKESLPKKSPLLKFNVFIDDDHIMRVGGRLDNSNFSYDKRHPILLQSTHLFTQLLFTYQHKRLMHAGPQLLLACIRETYWPIGGRNLAKACYHKCVLCQRMKGKIVTPLMGNLPQQRLLPGGFPFESVGVDYAGPIMSASRQGRGCIVKVYICIFVCFTTKAIHLELVGDLTSNTYLLAMRRFIARRGKPLHIFSDNGTSFVGACNDISGFLKSNCNFLSENMANDNINFHFIPAYTPHFGGLWEAGVKSTKYHLRRVLGNCNLTYEELNTTLTQIEAILNSRPLTPLSSEPSDCSPLTPGHLLIGRALTSLPQPDYQDHSTPLLTRFKRIEQLRQHFWERWSKEYVSELQQRVKWRSCKDGLKLDTLVVVKEDNLPPLKWRMGRVVAVHPGSDGIARVADIRTSTGVIRRAFSRICPLPVAPSSC
ncbi:unnamed protein product [Plutella xylostella]|uniref:(diamondback moth) hypothetical protein n=1 Tax=Plutella xylostella TaxID=51655 RepID=A0A8S4E3U5_PLUXY|nr:unnamed protein product [Plutella xylostella]